MEKIDWDNAPEWADKYGVAGPQALRCWYSDKRYAYISDPKEIFFFGNFDTFSRHIKDFTIIDERPSPSWSGEGLPPVGVVCEFKSPSSGGWSKARIVFVSGWTMVLYVFFEHDEHCYSVRAFEKGNLQFRPIRTPEQIAADEREAAIKDLISITSDGVTSINLCDAARIYDAGYRKHEDQK